VSQAHNLSGLLADEQTVKAETAAPCMFSNVNDLERESDGHAGFRPLGGRNNGRNRGGRHHLFKMAWPDNEWCPYLLSPHSPSGQEPPQPVKALQPARALRTLKSFRTAETERAGSIVQ
jgi:hypothetical protein